MVLTGRHDARADDASRDTVGASKVWAGGMALGYQPTIPHPLKCNCGGWLSVVGCGGSIMAKDLGLVGVDVLIDCLVLWDSDGLGWVVGGWFGCGVLGVVVVVELAVVRVGGWGGGGCLVAFVWLVARLAVLVEGTVSVICWWLGGYRRVSGLVSDVGVRGGERVYEELSVVCGGVVGIWFDLVLVGVGSLSVGVEEMGVDCRGSCCGRGVVGCVVFVVGGWMGGVCG
ncbi:hypothetical protein Tco_0199480 [Tanacetum coccineum]